VTWFTRSEAFNLKKSRSLEFNEYQIIKFKKKSITKKNLKEKISIKKIKIIIFQKIRGCIILN
jgi:hypothetical protein